MTQPTVRLTVRVPAGRAEEARAAALELVPAGFEEVTDGERLSLVLYVAEGESEAVRRVFPDARAALVEPGWEETWRAFHRPVRVGGVWIGPPWEKAPAGEPSVVIDPGRAFGTGAHPTTQLCVELLAAAPRGSLLDLGCGSGVLGIAAARLGYGPIVAVDDDPVAVAATRANAAVNGVALAALATDATAGRLPAVEIAVANILLAPVQAVLSRLDARAAITSGYLAGQRPAVAGWEWCEGRELDGWAADLFRRATV